MIQMQPRYTKVPVKDDHDEDGLLPSSSSSLKQRTMQPTQKVIYHNQPEDLRFEEMEPQIPYKSVLLAIFLTIFGINCFALAWMHWTQQLLGKRILDPDESDRETFTCDPFDPTCTGKEQAEFGFMFLGLMTFIPGAYHCRLALGAWRGERGYVWELIPEI